MYIHVYIYIYIPMYIYMHTHTLNANLHIPSTKSQCLPYSRYSIHTHPMSKPFKE